jgi:glyoxylase-like metal-dependent hydrolase (beta-lactamase superfamily II)
MLVKVIPVGLLSVNCSVVVDEESGQALIIDPGADAQKILKALEGYEPIGILATHGHIDHVGQVKRLKEELKVPFYLHRADLFLINDPIWPGFERQIGASLPCPDPDFFLEEGMEIKVGKSSLLVMHTPGHTPGLCCLYSPVEKLLIAGDLLFRGGVGRWDLPGGDLEALKGSLRRVFSELEDDVLVICGHYEETTIGQERRFNPYLRELL